MQLINDEHTLLVPVYEHDLSFFFEMVRDQTEANILLFALQRVVSPPGPLGPLFIIRTRCFSAALCCVSCLTLIL